MSAQIKTAYVYYDKKFEVYNMFIFLTYCSVGLCVHRIADKMEKFYYKNQLMSDSNIFLFESTDLMSLSIHDLKQKLPVKKIRMAQSSLKYIDCFDCCSCNYALYFLGVAFKNDPESVLKHGIYCDYEGFAYKADTFTTKLSECLNMRSIIQKDTDLSEKLLKFFSLGYKREVFNDEFMVCKMMYCEIENCQRDMDEHTAWCSVCVAPRYGLCKDHCTQSNIDQHVIDAHSGETVTFGTLLPDDPLPEAETIAELKQICDEYRVHYYLVAAAPLSITLR